MEEGQQTNEESMKCAQGFASGCRFCGSLLHLPSSSLSLSLLMCETDKHIQLACMLHAKSLQSYLTV